MKITFVRHGETESNRKKIVQGHIGGRLTKKGKLQARKLAKRLAKEKFDFIYSSDLQRAKETAKEIKKYNKNTKIIYTRELRELNQGIFEGKSSEKMRQFFKSKKLSPYWKPKGGESLVELKSRLNKFLKKIYKKHKGKHILIIAHGGTNRAIWYICHNQIPNFNKKSKRFKVQDNCCVNIMKFTRKGKPKLVLYNCTKHLT